VVSAIGNALGDVFGQNAASAFAARLATSVVALPQ